MSPATRATWPEGSWLTLARALAWWPLWALFGKLKLGQGLAAATALAAGWMVARVAKGTGERVSLSGAFLAAVVVGIGEAGLGFVGRPLLARMPVAAAVALGVWVTCVVVFELGRWWFALGFASEPPHPRLEGHRRRAAHLVFAGFALLQLALPHGEHGGTATWMLGAFGPALLPGVVGPAVAWATARPIDAVRTGPADPLGRLLPVAGMLLATAMLFVVARQILGVVPRSTPEPVGLALVATPFALAAAVVLFSRARRAGRGARAVARNDRGDGLHLTLEGGPSWIAAQTADVRGKLDRFADGAALTLVAFRGSTRPAEHAFRGTSAVLEEVRAYEETPERLVAILGWRAVGWAAWGVVGLCEVARSVHAAVASP